MAPSLLLCFLCFCAGGVVSFALFFYRPGLAFVLGPIVLLGSFIAFACAAGKIYRAQSEMLRTAIANENGVYRDRVPAVLWTVERTEKSREQELFVKVGENVQPLPAGHNYLDLTSVNVRRYGSGGILGDSHFDEDMPLQLYPTIEKVSARCLPTVLQRLLLSCLL